MLTLSVALIVMLALGFYLLLSKSSKKKDHVVLNGIVDVNQIEVAFRIGGRISELYCREGDFVIAGTLMAKLDEDFLIAEIQSLSEKIETLKAESDPSLADLYAAEAALDIAQNNLKYNTALRAPSDGIVLSRVRDEGRIVQSFDPIYLISAYTSDWIGADANKQQIEQLRTGLKGRISINSKQIYDGKIGFISDSSSKGKYLVRMDIDQPDGHLKPGTPVTIKIYK